ncbi:MAG: hypothetical protein ACQESN_10665 [Thermotogota bacterium]
MKFVNRKEIINIFLHLNHQNFKYILLRNIDNELPGNLKIKKDIDILLDFNEYEAALKFFTQHGYKKIKHPFDRYQYLYNTPEHLFLYNEIHNIKFDICFDICVKSLDFNSLKIIPLDKSIQQSAWENMQKVVYDDFQYYSLSKEDELTMLIARSVFDKKEFTQGYQNRIKLLLFEVNKQSLIEKLNVVFFKFTPTLIKLLEELNFNQIYTSYLSFRSY